MISQSKLWVTVPASLALILYIAPLTYSWASPTVADNGLSAGMAFLALWGLAFALGCLAVGMASRQGTNYGAGIKFLAILSVAFPVIIIVGQLISLIVDYYR